MKRRLTLRRLGSGFYEYTIVFIIFFAVALCLLPVMHAAAISLSSNSAIINDRVTIIPVEMTLQSHIYVGSDPAMWQSMLVTVVITAAYTVLGMTLTVLAAYPLTKKWLPGRRALLLLFLFTLFFGGGVIPNYLLIKELGLLNTLFALILPPALSIWNMIIMKTFLASIPESLMESAHIDGANEFTILVKIVLPLSLPVVASLSLFYAVFKWNSFQDALFYINDRSLQPIQLTLYNIVMDLESPSIAIQEGAGAQTNRYPKAMKAASIMFAAIPIVCVYPWLQKYFVKGLTVGSIKG
ncbi:MAG: carbohydrate ABC transporter permease [Spirochaetales bacterium]|nr:carbohydrate ABC transporter permease [Spirochaetales bacterium]